MKWLTKLLRYASVQGLSQVIAFATGVLVVRSFAKVEYAHYSLSISMIAAVTFLADSGINAVLMSRGGALLDNRTELGGLFSDGLTFRRKFGWIVVLLGVLALAWLLTLNETSRAETAIYCALVALNFVPILTIGILQAYHRLSLDFVLLQRTTIVVAILRLVLVLGLVFSGHLSVVSLLLANIACSCLTAFILFRSGRRNVDLRSGRGDNTSAFLANVKRTFPMVLLVVSGEQIYLAILSIRSTPEILAEAAALSKFAVAFVVINAIVSDIAAPLLARTAPLRFLLAKRMTLVIGAYFAAGALVVVAVALVSSQLLAILGPDYEGLELPLVVFSAGYALSYVGYAFDTMNQARGWLSHSWVYIPLLGLWVIFGLSALDLLKVENAALLFASMPLPMLITQVVRFATGLRAIPPGKPA